jgi:hypothetical protein
MPLIPNFLPCRPLYFKRNMCPAPPKRKNKRKMALTGTSGMIEGTWPRACEVGRYGGASCGGGPCYTTEVMSAAVVILSCTNVQTYPSSWYGRHGARAGRLDGLMGNSTRRVGCRSSNRREEGDAVGQAKQSSRHEYVRQDDVTNEQRTRSLRRTAGKKTSVVGMSVMRLGLGRTTNVDTAQHGSHGPIRASTIPARTQAWEVCSGAMVHG